MPDNLKLLVLAAAPSTGRGLEFRAERNRALTILASLGAKVRHDSGGRLLVVEVAENAEKALTERLAGSRLVPVDADLKGAIRDMDPTESLFLEALRIRSSTSYRDAKRRRKVGDTPEERDLVSGPDVREEY